MFWFCCDKFKFSASWIKKNCRRRLILIHNQVQGECMRFRDYQPCCGIFIEAFRSFSFLPGCFDFFDINFWLLVKMLKWVKVEKTSWFKMFHLIIFQSLDSIWAVLYAESALINLKYEISVFWKKWRKNSHRQRALS